MTVTELAKILARHIQQGRGEFQVCAHQWNYGCEPATEVLTRDSAAQLEIYTGTEPYAEPAPGHRQDDDDVGDLI